MSRIPASEIACPCGKTFINRQARYSHKKFCKGGNPYELEVARLTKIVNELELSKTTNLNFQINNFGKEDTSMITHDMMRDIIKSGDLRTSLQYIIKTLHFNPQYPANMNVYLPHMSQGYFLLKKVWKFCEVEDLAKRVMYNAADFMLQHRETDQVNEYTKEEQEKFDRFYSSFNHEAGVLQSTIRTIIDNYKLVEPRVYGLDLNAAIAMAIAFENANKANDEDSD